jgi:hypothetical protein
VPRWLECQGLVTGPAARPDNLNASESFRVRVSIRVPAAGTDTGNLKTPATRRLRRDPASSPIPPGRAGDSDSELSSFRVTSTQAGSRATPLSRVRVTVTVRVLCGCWAWARTVTARAGAERRCPLPRTRTRIPPRTPGRPGVRVITDFKFGGRGRARKRPARHMARQANDAPGLRLVRLVL